VIVLKLADLLLALVNNQMHRRDGLYIVFWVNQSSSVLESHKFKYRSKSPMLVPTHFKYTRLLFAYAVVGGDNSQY
jgi:hypothetical protein